MGHDIYVYFKTQLLGVVISLPAGQQRNRGLILDKGQQFITSPKLLDFLYCPHYPYLIGIDGSLPGVKRSGREVDHSPPSRAKVKNEWSYTSTPAHAFIPRIRLRFFLIDTKRQKVCH